MVFASWDVDGCIYLEVNRSAPQSYNGKFRISHPS